MKKAKVKINPVLKEILEHTQRVSTSIGIKFFVVGATARDIILLHIFGINPGRATRDLDLGVAVDTWGDFEKLHSSLLNIRGFSETGVPQTIRFKGYKLDLVPFGKLESPKGIITWQDANNFKMTTVGFEEAFNAATHVVLEGGPEIRVAGLAGVFALKCVAFNDNPSRSTDAQDIVTIAVKYFDAGNEDRVYDEHSDLVELDPYTIERAGSVLLGRDLRKLVNPITAKIVKQVLSDAINEVSDLLKKSVSRENPKLDANRELIKDVLFGFEGRRSMNGKDATRTP